MDPNATLARIREILTDWQEGEINDDGDELVELISSLDGWLSQGGHLPSYWTPVSRRIED